MALQDMLGDYSNVEEKAKVIKDIEHDGDTITHEIIRKRGGVRLEVLLHHEDRWENRNKGVERKEC